MLYEVITFVERIKSKSKGEFNKVCIEQIKSKIKDLDNYDYSDNLKRELSTYDSEGEFFTVITSYSIHYTKLYDGRDLL